jgi:hypothetical protein
LAAYLRQSRRVSGCTWLAAVALTVMMANTAQAQTSAAPPIPSAQIFYSNIQPLTDIAAQAQNDPRPSSTDGALQIYNWLVFGSLAVGGAYDSNVTLSPSNPITAYGLRLTPNVIAEYNTGIQRTFIYGTGDFRYYPSLDRTQIWNSAAGIVHIWEIERGFTFRAQAQIAEGESPLGFTNIGNNAVVAIEPVQATSLYGSTSIQRDIGLFFGALGGSVTHQIFSDTQTVDTNIAVPESYRDGTTSTLSGRLGYNVSPVVYAFVEPSFNTASYDNSSLNSDGYRFVAGLGSGRIGLVNGEIYGGFINQHFDDQSIAPLTAPVYGGHLSYYPTRFLTLTASVAQEVATSDYNTRAFLPGSITYTNTSSLKASWDVNRYITLAGTFQYSHWEYLGSTLLQDYWTTSADFTYWFTPKFGLTLDYSRIILDSNIVGGNYADNFVSAGAKTRF